MHGNQKQTDWAYIAGVMDSDGCFMIGKRNRKYTGKNKGPKSQGFYNPNYLPITKIEQKEIDTIKYITEDLGLGYYKLDRTRIRQYENGKRFGSHPIYQWQLTNRLKVMNFCKNIIPYLKIKKKRVLHLLNFCENMELKNYGWGRTISKDELNYREEAYLKMRKFNGSKVAATTEPRKSERISDSLNS